MSQRQKEFKLILANDLAVAGHGDNNLYINSLNLALHIFSANYAQVSFLENNMLVLTASVGQYGAIEIDPNFELDCLEHGSIVYIDNSSDHSHDYALGVYKSALGLPLYFEGQKKGVLTLYSKDRVDYNLKKQPLVEGLAKQLMNSYFYQKNEQAYIEQKIKTHAIYEGSSDAIIVLTSKGIVDCNQKCLEMFGFESKEEMTHLHPGELSPKTQPCGSSSYLLAEEKIKQAMKKGSLSFRWLHKKKNNESFNCEILLSAFEYAGRTLIQASIRDIDVKIKLEKKLEGFQNTLLKMSYIESELSIDQKIKMILEMSSRALNVERSSFWYFDEKYDSIWTPYIFSLENNAFLPGYRILRTECPTYFKEIIEKRSLVSHDAKKDIALREFSETYIEAENIGAMLDRVVHQQGHLMGILCHEHIGGMYLWDVHEQAFSSSVADRIAMILKDEEIKKRSEEVIKIKEILEDVEQIALIGGWEIDLETMTITWTKQTYEIYGISQGMPLALIDFVKDFPAHDQKIFLDAIQAAIESSKSFEKHFQLQTKSGAMKWLKFKGDVVCDLSKRNKIKGSIQDITEMKSREIELISTKDRINRIINSSPAVTYERTSSSLWDISYVSHHIYDMTGYTANEITHNPDLIINAIHKDDIVEITNILLHSERTGSSYDFRYRFYHKNGDLRWAWDRGGFSSSHTITGVILDVTNEVKATEGMQNLKQALDESALISITDLSGRITYVNQKFCELSGYENYELIGKNHSILKSDEHKAEFFHEMWGELLKGNIWRGQIKNRSKTGECYWQDTLIHPLKGQDGQLKEFLSITHDITKAKRLEAIDQFVSKLRAHFINYENQPERFFESMLDMLLKTLECRFGFIGEVKYEDNGSLFLQTYHISDISWDEESRDFYIKNSPKGLEFKNMATLFGKVLRSGEPLLTNDPEHHPAAGGLPDGHPKLNSFAGIPIYYQGAFIAMIGLGNKEFGFYEDFIEEIQPAITVIGETIDAIKLKEKLKAQNRILEHNAKLASIGQLAAGVGHEINNPLAIMKGIVALTKDELTSNDLLTPSLEIKMSKIDTSIDRIATIVKGLRVFSRSDNSELSHFDICDLVVEVEGLLLEIYHNEGINLEFSYPQNQSIYIFGNRGRIQQVLMNLISNAKDAVEQIKDSVIRVEVYQNQKKLILKVIDSGHGISLEHREKIFEPFFTTKDVHKGTGIGLSLVSTIVREHEGKIDLTSELGKGTTFTVELPISNSSADIQSIYLDQMPSVLSFSHLNVLVVDDEEDLRDIISSILKEMGFNIFMASNGHEALNVLKNTEIHAIISDIVMPVMSGKDLMHQICQQEQYKDIKFILMSGDLNLDDYNSDKNNQGLSAIISKPFNIDEVRMVIASLFKK